MNEKTTKKLTREDETRPAKITRIVAMLPEKEQEQLYYMIQGHCTFKGLELAGYARHNNNAPVAAAQ